METKYVRHGVKATKVLDVTSKNVGRGAIAAILLIVSAIVIRIVENIFHCDVANVVHQIRR